MFTVFTVKVKSSSDGAMCALLKNNDVDGVRVHCSPDPIWFPPSSPPAPSAASSRSCGWGPRRGVLTWAAEEAHRAEAGVEVGAAVPWRSRNALFRHFNQEVCAQCAHRCSRSFQTGSFLFKLRCLIHLKPQGGFGALTSC